MKIAQFSRSARRAVVVCLAAGLTLSACASDDEEKDVDQAASASSSSKAPKPSETKKADKEKKEEEKKKREADAKKAEAEKKAHAPAKQGGAQAGGQSSANAQQRAGGVNPAGRQSNDEQQIRTLIMAGNDHAADPRAYFKYRQDNACQAVLDEVGGASAFTEAGDGLAATGLDLVPRINSIDSVTVNGNTARAQVTATSQDTTKSTPIDLSKEGGRWKFCG